MKHFTLFIFIASVILLIGNVIMFFYNLFNGASIWGHLLLSVIMLVTAYSSYKSYKKQSDNH